MYIVVIAWFYVVVLMSIVEATSPMGTLLGAAITFVLYGVLPLSIVVYILGTPGRRRKVHAREMEERTAWQEKRLRESQQATQPTAVQASAEPDARGHAPSTGDSTAVDASAIAPVRKEP